MKIKLSEVLPAVQFVAGFAGDEDPYRSVSFMGGAATATTGFHGAACEAPDALDGLSVPADQLAKVLGSLPQKVEEVEFDRTEGRVVVRAKQFRSQLPVIGGHASAKAPPKTSTKLDDAFWAALALAEATTGKTPTSDGVFWSADGALMSTDNLRVTIAKVVPCPSKDGAFIPSTFLRTRRRNLAAAAVDKDGSLWFLAKNASVWTSLVAVNFPAAQLLELAALYHGKKKKSTDVTFGESVNDVLDRLLLAAPEHGRVTVEVKKKTVRFSSQEEDKGLGAEELVDATVTGDEVLFTVNGRSLRYALDRFSGFRVQDPMRPVYFSNEEAGVEHLVVPLFAS